MYWHAVDVCACCWGLYAERRGVRANAGSKARIQLPVHRGSNGEMNYMGGRVWQMLADYACGCARRIRGGRGLRAVRPGQRQGTTRVRVCLSLSLSPQRSALSHITPLIIYQTHQRKTHNGNATRKRRTRHTRDTRARPRAHGGDIDVGARGPGVTRESVARKLRD